MDLVLAAVAVALALGAWAAWESTMASRLRRDRRPLAARNAALAGAHRLTVVGQLGLVVVATVAAGAVALPLWWHQTSVLPPVGGVVASLALVAALVAAAAWAARRGPRPADRRALLAVLATAVATEVVLRGFGLTVLEELGWSVTVAVLVTALATGALQAVRAQRGSRGTGFVLATVLGFALGLVVLLTGSVLAAAALHGLVAVVGLATTLPVASASTGCACGGADHDHGDTAAAPAVVATTGAASAPGAAAHGSADHACGSTCDHAGTAACAACPLSTAKV